MRSSNLDIFDFLNQDNVSMIKDLQEDLFEIKSKIKNTLDSGVSASEVDNLRALLECSQLASDFVSYL